MNTNTDLSTIKLWFERAVPTPTDKNRVVQVGCHLEEVAEMFDAFTPGAALVEILNEIADEMKAGPPDEEQATYMRGVFERMNRKELLDALCDQIVTAVGVAHMFGLDIGGALNEVNRSNWSKMVDGQPVFDANGKIAKGGNYTPPNLEPFV